MKILKDILPQKASRCTLGVLVLLDCDRKSINISDIIINMQKKLLTKARKKAIIDEMCKHISKKENL